MENNDLKLPKTHPHGRLRSIIYFQKRYEMTLEIVSQHVSIPPAWPKDECYLDNQIHYTTEYIRIFDIKLLADLLGVSYHATIF